MARVTWSPTALGDLAAIAEFIGRDSPHYAGVTVQRIVSRVERMADFPEAGRVVPENELQHVREFIEGSYRVVYRLSEGSIEVAAIAHGARRMPDSPP